MENEKIVKPVKLMLPAHWDAFEELGHFKRDEKSNGSDSFAAPHNMIFEFMVMLEKFRKEANRPVSIHCTYDKEGHSPKSMHKKTACAAADGHVSGFSLLDECRILVAMGFDGVGAYPYSWASRGFHMDMRSIYGKPKVCWIEDEFKTGKYIYYTDPNEFLLKLGEVESAKEKY
ncbi:MAG: hypothetical protein Unbinned7913contig1002_23 [Prokaryotic dsDNA virus sp.]|nr:hypothetical protein [Parcubacteria group bacterium]QDP51268.1 MAG: hypothetical protein Unbinned7913contig1002_23 [Prokaryotic dsDNA virus sp.]